MHFPFITHSAEGRCHAFRCIPFFIPGCFVCLLVRRLQVSHININSSPVGEGSVGVERIGWVWWLVYVGEGEREGERECMCRKDGVRHVGE